MPEESQFVLSGFADEIDPSLDVQLETLNKLAIGGLDLRSVEGVNVLDLEIDQLMRIHDQCQSAGVAIQSIGSPINKIPYDVMLQAREMDRLGKIIKTALRVNCKRIRLFTPELPADANGDLDEKIVDWMREQKSHADHEGLILIVENDARYWNAFPDNAKRLFEALGGPGFKAAFDFANTVLIGYKPLADWFPWLLPHLDTLHIKDAVAAEGRVVPAGHGDAEIEETLSWLVSQGWRGALTLEPHLQAAGQFGGFSGPQLFTEAATALRMILNRLGVEA